MTLKEDLVRDHAGLQENRQARRYFAKFETILDHLPRVAADMERSGRLSRLEMDVIGQHIRRLNGTFRALSHKYLMTGRDTGVFLGSLTVDRSASGFPVLQELLSMAADAVQAQSHLGRLPGEDALKDAMISRIVGERVIPTDLQYAMSQRLYYQQLTQPDMFWPTNDVEVEGVPGDGHHSLLHWAVWDGRRNLPVIWLMHVRDSARQAFESDAVRRERATAHLMAQALPELKLVTVAQGFDEDFDHLHPIRMMRLTVGPMYSGAFTRQTEGLGRVLEAARAPAGEDWALAWTLEELQADRTETEKTGWFSSVERTIFKLRGPEAAETGATRTERAAVLPERIYQALVETNAPGFRDVTKYVVGNGRLWRAG